MVRLEISDDELDEMEREVSEEAFLDITDEDLALVRRSIRFTHRVSTGSTLLDLAISANRVQGGGLPGGIIMEIYGPPGVGKTALAAEIAASVQGQEKGKGQVRFADPEARLDAEYSQIYGVDIQSQFFDYHRPDTVSEMFDKIINWKPDKPELPNAFIADSLAALSTQLELDKGDKMGQRRAKEFSEGFRKTCRTIANNDWLLVCTNQIRHGEYGTFTPGGEAIKFYSSVRLSLFPGKPHYITRKRKVKVTGAEKSVEVEKDVGIYTMVTVAKNSVDEPKRKAPIYIIFGYGVDDIRANLQYIKNMKALTTYKAVDRSIQQIVHAINHIEKNNLAEDLRQETIQVWNETNEQLQEKRVPKVR
jgi:recombination protein RecA